VGTLDDTAVAAVTGVKANGCRWTVATSIAVLADGLPGRQTGRDALGRWTEHQCGKVDTTAQLASATASWRKNSALAKFQGRHGPAGRRAEKKQRGCLPYLAPRVEPLNCQLRQGRARTPRQAVAGHPNATSIDTWLLPLPGISPQNIQDECADGRRRGLNSTQRLRARPWRGEGRARAAGLRRLSAHALEPQELTSIPPDARHRAEIGFDAGESWPGTRHR
jgi:hypothetical protein